MARATFKAKIIGAGRTAAKFRRGARAMSPVMFEELDDLAGRTTNVMKDVARYRSGAMSAQIHPEIIGGGFAVISDVASPEGFHYTRITREGHNVAWIYPVTKKALAFSIGGRRIIARRVRGFKPDHDWVEDGMPEVEAEAARSAERIGRAIIARMG